MMNRIAAAWIVAVLSLLFGSAPAMAVGAYLTGNGGFNSTYPASTTGTKASCNLCHSSGGGTNLNAYGKDWAAQHNNGLAVKAAYQAIETMNSDADPGGATNLAEITASAQPGWTAGAHNTLYDMFTLAPAASNQSPPAITGNLLDPATAAANQPPVLAAIGAKSVSEGQSLGFTATATDPDGNALAFSAGGLPAGATLSSGGVFAWTPTFAQAGNYNVTVTVTDNGTPPQSDFEIVTITVGNVNRPPVLGALAASQSAAKGVAKTLPITATDPDGDALVIAGSNLPTGATVTDNNNGTATFAWTPGPTQAGAYPDVTITVTDKGTPPQGATAKFTITVADGNQPPVLAPIGARTASVGSMFALQATATDPEGNVLAFSAGNLPAGAALTPAGALSWTPTAGQTGPSSMTITVTDNGVPPQSASETFTITVGGVNQPPVLAPIGARTVDEGQLLEFTATASDPDGNALAFSSATLPTGATLSPGGAFKWKPGYTQAGTYPVTISVSDGTATASETFTITVGNTNRPPVLAPSPIGNRTAVVGQALTIALTASDPDGDPLSFGSTTLPAGATLVPNGSGAATFSFTPTAAQVGSFPNVSIAVSDGDLSDVEVFTITVSATGTTPPPASGSLRIGEARWSESRLRIKGQAKLPAGTTVTVIDADTARTLGTTTVGSKADAAPAPASSAADDAEGGDDDDDDGESEGGSKGTPSLQWQLNATLDSVPCRVQATAAGQASAIIVVGNARRLCRSTEKPRHRD